MYGAVLKVSFWTSFTYLFYSVVFVIGFPLIFYDLRDTIIPLMIIMSLFFGVFGSVLLSNIHMRFTGLRRDRHVVLILRLLGFGIPICYFLLFGVPVFSSNVESSRLLLGQRLGMLNRVWLSSLSVYVLYEILCSYRRYKLVILLAVIVLFTTGFRARPVDLALSILFTIILSNRLKVTVKTILGTLSVGLVLFYLVFYTTQQRFGGDALVLIIRRVFMINWDINFARVQMFTDEYGIMSFVGYLDDIGSVFMDTVSMQQKVTYAFNDSNLGIVMTLTHLGEVYLMAQAGLLVSVMTSIFYFFTTLKIANWAGRFSGNHSLRMAGMSYVLYTYPRVAVTAGVSSAFLTKIVPVILVFIIIGLIKSIFSNVKGSNN